MAAVAVAAALLPAISSASSSVRVVRTLHIATGPFGVADDGTHVWVATVGNGSQAGVTEISVRSGRVVRALEVGLGPLGIDSDGRYAWVTSIAGYVSGIDTRTGQITRSFFTGVPAVAVASDGTHLWITHGVPGSGPNGITELDIATGRLVRNIRTGPSAYVITADNRHVWTANVGSATPGHSVTEINERTGRVVRTIGTGLIPIAITSDGRRVFVATAEGLDHRNRRAQWPPPVYRRGGSEPQRHLLGRDARVGERRGLWPRRRDQPTQWSDPRDRRGWLGADRNRIRRRSRLGGQQRRDRARRHHYRACCARWQNQVPIWGNMMSTTLLTDTHRQVQALAREFAQAEIAPYAAEWNAAHHVPVDVLRKMGELGLLAVIVPEELGGAGLDATSLALVVEEIARADAGTSTAVAVQNGLVAAPLLRSGSAGQQAAWLPRLATGEIFGAYALTEPDIGSDTAALRTSASARDGGWSISGAKQWITNGGFAELYVVFARTGGPGAKGISAFLTERGPGLEVGREIPKMGLHTSSTVELSFDGLEVPADALLGNPGEGLKLALATLDGGRITVAAQACGIAQAALDLAIDYAGTRVAFGGPIARFQGIQFPLADVAAKLDAARLLPGTRPPCATPASRMGLRAPRLSCSQAPSRLRPPTWPCRRSAATATRPSSRPSGTTATPRSPRSTRAPARSSAW